MVDDLIKTMRNIAPCPSCKGSGSKDVAFNGDTWPPPMLCSTCKGSGHCCDPEAFKLYVREQGQQLRNLLAVIHRDNGSYTEKHGLDKSVYDAMQISSIALVSSDIVVMYPGTVTGEGGCLQRRSKLSPSLGSDVFYTEEDIDVEEWDRDLGSRLGGRTYSVELRFIEVK